MGKKRKAASLMEKSRRVAESKRKGLQPATAAPSTSTPRNLFHLSDLSEEMKEKRNVTELNDT
jgi:hypothetical protein